jgi:hypothetical protein
MFILPAVVTCNTLTPPAEIAAVHFTARYHNAIAACMEIPHPDHDAGGLSVNPVTGAPSEFSQVSQVTFTVPVLMPWRTPEFPPDSNRRVGVQTRALGQVHRPASKMRGRR